MSVRIEPLADIHAPKVPNLFRRQLVCWDFLPADKRIFVRWVSSSRTDTRYEPIRQALPAHVTAGDAGGGVVIVTRDVTG
jgi:hypothetical protein